MKPDQVLVSHGYENIYERGFCNGLTDHGIPFVLISSDRTDYAGLRPGTATLNLRGSQEEDRPRLTKALNMLWYHLRLMAFVLRRRPRSLHVFGQLSPAFLCGVVEGLLFRWVCGRYVLTVHNLLPHDSHTRWNALVCRLSFRAADGLVVHTVRMREQLISMYGIEARRIVVMQHGIEPRTGLHQSAQGSALPPKVSSERLNILFFGKVLRYKGVDLLLSALENFTTPFDLTIGGGVWDDTLRTELRAQIAAHPQRDHIHWKGTFVPEAEIAGLFERADILVLPYRHIDQSGILFQALRFGVPVVATRVGSLADYVSDEIGEVCAPNDVPALRGALQRLQARLHHLSRANIQALARRYEWSRTVEPLREVYRIGEAPQHLAGSAQATAISEE